MDHPDWNDNQLYWKVSISMFIFLYTDSHVAQARSYVIGMLQRIVWEEWLPALLGSQYQLLNGAPPGSPEELFVGTPMISTEFDVVTYRFGHSMVGNTLGNRALVDLFFNPTLVVSEGIETFIRDAVYTRAQAVDEKVVDTLRNNLFGPPSNGAGEDLISRNMVRSVEVGMANYTAFRALYNIGPEWPEAPANRQQLAFIGVLSEPRVSGSSLPRTIAVSIAEQFRRIKRYDSNWYDRPESIARFGPTYAPLVLGATLRDIVLRNTDLTASQLGYQSNLFYAP